MSKNRQNLRINTSNVDEKSKANNYPSSES